MALHVDMHLSRKLDNLQMGWGDLFKAAWQCGGMQNRSASLGGVRCMFP